MSEEANENEYGYYNCSSHCTHRDDGSSQCDRKCDRQTKSDGSHPGYEHNCPVHGGGGSWN
jgi:hypothetical protein